MICSKANAKGHVFRLMNETQEETQTRLPPQWQRQTFTWGEPKAVFVTQSSLNFQLFKLLSFKL